jgi:hypothetical protein
VRIKYIGCVIKSRNWFNHFVTSSKEKYEKLMRRWGQLSGKTEITAAAADFGIGAQNWEGGQTVI